MEKAAKAFLDPSKATKPAKFALLQDVGPDFAVCASAAAPAATPWLKKLVPSTTKECWEDFESLSMQCDALLAENERQGFNQRLPAIWT